LAALEPSRASSRIAIFLGFLAYPAVYLCDQCEVTLYSLVQLVQLDSISTLLKERFSAQEPRLDFRMSRFLFQQALEGGHVVLV
jgi:hypothetical protein